jgi:hypothetical protein
MNFSGFYINGFKVNYTLKRKGAATMAAPC